MRRRTHGVSALGAVVLGALAAATADAKLSKTGDSAVVAHTTATGRVQIDATTSSLQVSEPGSTINLVVPLGTLKTGIALRDRHMREKFLEVDKYPDAELKVERSKLKFPADGAELDADAPATLTLHGQTKPVNIHYHAGLTGENYAVRGSTNINILDFGITQPSFLGVTVSPNVSINVRFQVKDSK